MKQLEFEKLCLKNNCDCNPNEDYYGTFKTTVSVLYPFPIYIKGVDYPQYKFVSIDKCILPEILYLWDQGIETDACCCGHNHIKGNIMVKDNSIKKMELLGYKRVKWKGFEKRKDAFYSKTCG